MDLNRHRFFKPKKTIVFLDFGCYASAISLLLAEMFVVVCITKWLLYGVAGYTDFYFLFLCIIMAFILKNEIEFLWLSKEYIFKMIEVENELR